VPVQIVKIALIVLAAWNLAVMLIYGWDKFKATRNLDRISEKILIRMAFLGGALGALLGMQLFRHKIRSKLFIMNIPFALVINIVVLLILKFMLGI